MCDYFGVFVFWCYCLFYIITNIAGMDYRTVGWVTGGFLAGALAASLFFGLYKREVASGKADENRGGSSTNISVVS